MAAVAQSLIIPAVGASHVGQVHINTKKTRTSARAGPLGLKNAQTKASAISTSGFKSFTGMRKASEIDTLTVKQGRDFKSIMEAALAVEKQGWTSKGVTTAMFERFTEKAIKVIMLAQEEARRLGHNFVGTEQILLGLIGEGTGIAAKVLKSMGVNLKEARVEVEKIIGRGSGFVAVEIPFTPRAKRVLELSLEEARQLGEFTFIENSLVHVGWFLSCFDLKFSFRHRSADIGLLLMDVVKQVTITLEPSICSWVCCGKVKELLHVFLRILEQILATSELR